MKVDRILPPPNPGKVLRKRLEAKFEIAQDELADALGVSRFTVNQVLNGRRAISPDMALRLEAVLGTSPQMWLRLQADYDLFEARERLGDTLGQLPRLIDLSDEPPRTIKDV
jgi:addiction module HigA family antidote